MTSPSPTTPDQYGFTGVAFVPSGSGTAWAVGDRQSDEDTLTAYWDGDDWTVEPSPVLDDVGSLFEVAALGASDVWAVGAHGGSGKAETLTQHWDGSDWTAVSSPSPGDTSNQLTGLSAGASNYIWAVGFSKDTGTGGVNRNLALRWNGTSWSQVSMPNVDPVSPPILLNEMNGVEVVPGTNVCDGGDTWAVGTNNSANGSKTLILRYTLSEDPGC